MPDQESIFLKHTAQTTPFPLAIEVDYAKGLYIFDKQGKRYADMVSGIGVSVVGHVHAKVIEAIKAQVDRHMHVMVYGEMIQQPVNDLAVKLTELLPENLTSTYFVNSGTEANEGALKLAKRVTGRRQLIGFKNGYHGHTHGSLSISSNEEKKRPFRPLIPCIDFLEFNDLSELSRITSSTAAVIIEPIQGDAGVIIPPKKFMQELRDRCTQTGTILIFDEIQTGIGRTGTWFAFEQFDVVPDIISLAKGLGGGLPIGAFIASYDHMIQLSHDPLLGHITTFGGNPVSATSALATLKVIEDEQLLAKVEQKGRLIENRLQHSKIIEIRRAGLMLAIELKSEDHVNRVIEYCLEHGVILFWFLSTRNAFRISPPLTITEDQILETTQVILDSLDKL